MRRALLTCAPLVLSACVQVATHPAPDAGPQAPPDIEFAGVVTDSRTYAEHYEFTDGAGRIHAIEIDADRDVTSHGCCGPLLVLGEDGEGPFMASFPAQDGLPDDCFVAHDAGIDRGSHIELYGVLWRKAAGFEGSVGSRRYFLAATRFCLDHTGAVSRLVAP